MCKDLSLFSSDELWSSFSLLSEERGAYAGCAEFSDLVAEIDEKIEELLVELEKRNES